MSDRPAKTDKPDRPETAPVALPAPAPTQAPAVTPDAFHGRGGRYTVTNGVRQRVECTEATHAHPAQPVTEKAKE